LFFFPRISGANISDGSAGAVIVVVEAAAPGAGADACCCCFVDLLFR
jgi:hypothetical protein